MEDRSTVITITAGTIIKTILILAACALLYAVRGIALIVLTAVVIASAMEPAVKSLTTRFKLSRLLAVILVYVVLIAALISIFYLFLPSVIEDFSMFLASIPKYVDTLTHSSAFSQYGQIIGLSQKNGVSPGDLFGAFDLRTYFGDPLSALTAIFGGIFSFILILVFSFYFAVMDTGVDDFLRIVTPKNRQAYVLGLWRRSQHKIGLWMQGQILLAVIMGVIVFLGLTIFGVPHALVLSLITACFEIIPVFGVFFAAFPSVAIAFAAGGAPLGLITIALYMIAQQFENHLIYPLVVTRVVGVPPLLVIIALITGGQLAGFLGIILSVPAAATIRELARDYESGRLGARLEAE